MQRMTIALAILNALTFLLYVADKATARRGGNRIPENVLHLCALMGGWVGALLAQRLFHHKTGKRSFQSIFLITILVNGAFLFWVFRH